MRLPVRNSPAVLACLGLLLVACGGAATPQQAEATPVTDGEGGGPMTFRLSSTAFEHEGGIPVRYTCDGEDLSPPLLWEGVPEGTLSLALIMDDPDAPMGTWVHWVVYDLPAAMSGLEEGVPPEPDLPGGGRHGTNSWRRLGYGGPCPPGGTHRYFFKLYALDVEELGLPAGASKEEVLRAMEGHVLAEATLMGRYGR